FPAELTEAIAKKISARHGLQRDEILFTFSHTHGGPAIRNSLSIMYATNEQQSADIEAYAEGLQPRYVELVGQALAAMRPVQLSFGRGQADFGVNRRLLQEQGYVIGVNPQGPVDHSVPVLKIVNEQGTLTALLFGYTCHNTTLQGNNYLIHGDYAGVAQKDLQEKFPGAVALFMNGFAGDTNPHPRGTLELAQQHGLSLSAAVQAVLSRPLQSLHGRLKSHIRYAELPLSTPPTRQELLEKKQDPNKYVRAHAEQLLALLDKKGKLDPTYHYPIQTIQVGDSLLIVALAGEVLVDYALRLQKEIEQPGRLWTVGYSNDVFAYVPSRRVLEEGGYEAKDSMIYYGWWPWSLEMEEVLMKSIHRGIRQVR
ncbi:MAG TPA: hypothetical protein PLZ01_09320, partial [bacterium]|nr:hypothetical protein [bacterium]